MFVDKAKVKVKAGDGGDGAVSFRQEKFVDRGGPDGGDGGKGGDIIFVGSNSENTLANFRYKKELCATPGKPGTHRKKHGRNGQNLCINVPVGTVILNSDNEQLADLVQDGQTAIVARGGKGGFGNAHFTSSTRQAPRIAEKGEPGDEYELILELKMIADVGLIGLPNAGKSTLLSVISNAKPEIADYPFTTLTPNLGVADIDGSSSLLFADIPGLIEGAAEGKGLGDDFLRHVERTAVMLHLIDVYNDDPAAAYLTIQKELAAYSKQLAKRPQIIVITKTEGMDQEIIDDAIKNIKSVAPQKAEVAVISAQSKAGVAELLRATYKMVQKERKKKATAVKKAGELPVIKLEPREDDWTVSKTRDGFKISGIKIERFAVRTDFSSNYALERLRDIIKKMGIEHELLRKGIKRGDKIFINKSKIVY